MGEGTDLGEGVADLVPGPGAISGAFERAGYVYWSVLFMFVS